MKEIQDKLTEEYQTKKLIKVIRAIEILRKEKDRIIHLIKFLKRNPLTKG